VARVRLTGTHLGEGLGVPPSGKTVSIQAITIVRVDKGKIVEGWNNWDQLGLLKQVGALPGAEAPDRFLTARP
jgi:predicted ester cyclase